MLQQARARRKDGYDIVVGVVETHGRKETEALLEGLEVIPRRRLEYRGQWLEEMDLDAIIARRPQIVLVDELAHTNAPGSRHPKRYLDVEELLQHGIDVYSTVNIQHIESLNDVVAQITHVRVRETVPDSVFDRADAVELVDLTPEDLIQRLKEGKVYVPKQAERALTHFFSPANLTALRELALRRTAERVDEQLFTEMQARAIQGPWAAGERILVCISEDPRAAGLVRYAKRLADRLHGPWTALYVETRRSLQLSEERAGSNCRYLATWRRRWAATQSQSPAAAAAWPTMWSPMLTPITSPRSLSGSPRAHAGSRLCTGPSSTILFAAQGTSAFTSSRARPWRESRSQRRSVQHGEDAGYASIRDPICFALVVVGGGGSCRRVVVALDRHREYRAGVPHRHRRHCGLVSVCGRRSLASIVSALVLQFLFHPIRYYTFTISDPTRRPRSRLLHVRGVYCFQRGGAGADSGGCRDGSGADHGVALLV